MQVCHTSASATPSLYQRGRIVGDYPNPHRSDRKSEPMTSFLLGSLSSLISAAFGYWAGGLRRANEDSKRRQSLATALLFELRPLERMLRTRATHSHAAES